MLPALGLPVRRPTFFRRGSSTRVGMKQKKLHKRVRRVRNDQEKTAAYIQPENNAAKKPDHLLLLRSPLELTGSGPPQFSLPASLLRRLSVSPSSYLPPYCAGEHQKHGDISRLCSQLCCATSFVDRHATSRCVNLASFLKGSGLGCQSRIGLGIRRSRPLRASTADAANVQFSVTFHLFRVASTFFLWSRT